MWKNYSNWFKGACIGLIVGVIVSLGITSDIFLYSILSVPSVSLCQIISQCNITGVCVGCEVIGMIFNLIIGFVVGAIIGSFFKDKKTTITNKKLKKRRK